MPDTTYYKKPEETVDQYNTRIADFNASKSITSQSIAPTDTFQLPETQPEPSYDLASIPVADLMQSEPTQTEKTQNTLEDRYLTAIGKLSGKEVAQQSAEQNAGLPAFQSSLNDINNQIRTLQAEGASIPLQAQQQAQGRGITAGGLRPIETAALRNNAIQGLQLSAVAQALQGNIALAQQQADRAVEVQFAPLEREIEFLREAMSINEKRMGREDQKRQQNLNIILSERERLLNNAKEDKKIIMGWASEAAKLGNAPSLIINKALAAKNPMAALSILSPYMSDPMEKEAAILDLQFKREQIANARQDRYIADEKLKLDRIMTEAQLGKLQQEAAAAAGTNNEANQTRLGAVDLINNILSVDTSAVTGVANPFTAALPSNAMSKNQINQLRAILALENRAKLKGSGAVSDYESRILNQSSSALGDEGWIRASNLSDSDFQNELKKVRGVLTVMNGGNVNVIIRTPDGKTQRGAVNREGLNKAIQQGYTVLYE